MQTLSHIRPPTKLKQIYKDYKDKEFKLLDIGCRNHPSSLFKKWFSTSKILWS
ncbi:MAG: hypothetical protein WCT85_02660 [Parachlamydiales bacterium]